MMLLVAMPTDYKHLAAQASHRLQRFITPSHCCSSSVLIKVTQSSCTKPNGTIKFC